MPDYVVTDPKTGKKLKLTGDKPPSEAELNQIFSKHFSSQSGTADVGFLNRSLASVAGAPVDLVNLAVGAKEPFLGSENIMSMMRASSIATAEREPETVSENIMGGIGNVVGNLAPFLGLTKKLQAAKGVVGTIAKGVQSQFTKSPAIALASEVGAGVGMGAGRSVTDNPMLQPFTELAGGVAGGGLPFLAKIRPSLSRNVDKFVSGMGTGNKAISKIDAFVAGKNENEINAALASLKEKMYASDDPVKYAGAIDMIKQRTGQSESPFKAIENVRRALRKVPKARTEQEALISRGKAQRAESMREELESKFSGEELAIKKRQLLKAEGEFEKVEFESIRKLVTQDDINDLFNVVKNSKLTTYDKLTAEEGLLRLLGARGTNLPTRSQADMLSKVLPADFMKELSNKRSFMQKLWGEAENALNMPRTMMATADFSAPFRQGVFLIRRQKQFAPAFKEMFKYAFSPKAYDGLMDDIAKRPNYGLMKESKLALTDLGSSLNLREEAIMSNLPEKIPLFGRVVKGSNRAYSGFLNKMRADVFDDLINKASKQGFDVNVEAKGIASYVNAATGRGDLPKFLADSGNILNATLFSPRLIASRVQLIGKLFNPKLYTKKNAFIRKEYLKDLAGFLTMGSTVLGLAKFGGADVGLDPRSSDFGKIKVGNTRYDIWGGFQQYVVLVSRILTGEMINSTTGREITLGEGGYKPTTRTDILARAAEFKLSPVTSFVWSGFRGTNAIGEDFKIAPEVLNRMIPIVAQDVQDIIRDEGFEGLPMVLPAPFGVGVQTYGNKVPYKSTTPSGKENVKWRLEPSLGEVIVNSITGEKISTIPKHLHEGLQKEKEKKDLQRIQVSAAKERVLLTGRSEMVNGVFIYLQNGIVKARYRRTR